MPRPDGSENLNGFEIVKIVRIFEETKDVHETARRCKRHADTVRRHLRRQGIDYNLGRPERVISKEQLTQLLKNHNGNASAVARHLGRYRQSIYRSMKDYGIRQ